MITQLLIDWWCGGVAIMFAAVPPPPTQFLDAAGWIADAGEWFSDHMSPLGVLFPWGSVTMILQWWLGVTVFWLTTIPLTALLRLGRVAK